MKIPLLLCVSSFIIAGLCFAGEKHKTLALKSGVTLQIPDEVRVHHQNPAGDFDLFTFKKDSRVVLNAYFGNQPDFPKKKGAGRVEKTTINGLNVESIIHRQTDETVSREVLFHLRETNGWPQRLHCWYEELSSKESAEADGMISSVRLNLLSPK